MEFQINATSQGARACTIKTAHSTILTPVFMPVGTQGTVKALDANDMLEMGAKIILGNTYHLYLRPGSKLIKKFGGLHGFSKFPNSFLTDSGGFQAFSLSDNSKPDENGIMFKSHIDGSKHYFTPKSVLDTQYDLGSDIMMILDDLVALPNTKERIAKSIERTTKWAKEAIEYHMEQKSKGIGVNQNIFAIIQGGTDKEFRKLSAQQLCAMSDYDGFAIGGLSVGEPNADMYETVEWTTQFMPKDKPRYLMGVGTPEDLIENIERGVDMFDCVMPTRNGRNGMLFTKNGIMNMRNKKWEDDYSPIEAEGASYVDTMYSRAYLRHLFHAQELLAMQIASIHNLAFYLWLAGEARKHIIAGDFSTWKPMMVKRLSTRL